MVIECKSKAKNLFAEPASFHGHSKEVILENSASEYFQNFWYVFHDDFFIIEIMIAFCRKILSPELVAACADISLKLFTI